MTTSGGSLVVTQLTPSRRMTTTHRPLPALIVAAGDKAGMRFLEFFAAPAKQTRNRVRSRAPARSVPQAPLNRLTSAVVSGAERRAGVPCFRPMPRTVSRIAGCLVSRGWPATPQARATAATRRRSVGGA